MVFNRLSQKVFIVAEIGNNHNGSAETAKALIDAAVDAGADAVKFQTFRGTDIVTPDVLSDAYPAWKVKAYTYWYEFLDAIALPFDAHADVFHYARSRGIIPFSTPTSFDAVDLLESIHSDLYKIASMDVTHTALLRKVAATNKPVILSTGMAQEEEIERAIQCFEKNRLVVLHCISDYPLAPQNANLCTLRWIKKRFNCRVGFSDHSLEADLAVAAVALGARVIEKHITLDRKTRNKAEHHFALEPSELRSFVGRIRQIEAALGDECLKRSPLERELKSNVRRSLHVNKPLEAGHILSHEDLVVLRPADGAAPDAYDAFIGKPLKAAKAAWAPVNKEDL